MDETSRKMGEYNAAEEARLKGLWQGIMLRIANSKVNRQSRIGVRSSDVNDALRQAYGVELKTDCTGVNTV